MSAVPLSKKKYFVLPLTRLKGTESAQNRKHTFLCYDLDCMLISLQNNLQNHKNKNNM